MSPPTVARVGEALDTVLDPCSVFNGTRLSIVELGMIDEVTVDKSGEVFVRLFLDDPTCIFYFEISRMLREAVGALDGVSEIEIEIKTDELWTEERIAPAARQRLESIRARRRDLHDERGVAAGWPLPMVDPEVSGTPLPMAREPRR